MKTATLIFLTLPLMANAFSTTLTTRLPSLSRHQMADNPEDTIETEAAIEYQQQESSPTVTCPDCDLCDGSGRISGGIGAVLDWWPIKAYRPCPNFIERGGQYSRSGQGLDEIAFGRDSKYDGPGT
jgi:hypothetical protein